jgi:hypothetical protein
MSDSLAPPVYSITSSDTITLSSPAIDAFTIDTSTMANITSGYNNVTIGGGSGIYYTAPTTINSISALTTAQIQGLTTIDTSTFSFKMPEEWEDRFPDFNRIQKMCKEYPGLQIAFEKFKTTYLLVKNHYDTPEDQRPFP